MGGLEFVGLELLAVLPIHDPLAGGFQMLARRDRGRAADHRHQVLTALDLHLENGKTVLGVVVGDTFDQAGEGFGHCRKREHGNATTGLPVAAMTDQLKPRLHNHSLVFRRLLRGPARRGPRSSRRKTQDMGNTCL